MGFKKRNEPEYLAWHFVAADRKLGYGDGREVRVGETLQMLPIHGNPEPCESGMHGSVKAFDALKYAPGPVVCRVGIWGDVQIGDDKLCGRYRMVIAMADATDVLRKFARLCALDVIHLWDAPNVVREYLETGDETKRAAAHDAADGVMGGAWAASAASATWAAAYVVATDAARHAAGYARRAAATDARWAADDAARVARWTAAKAAALAAARVATEIAAMRRKQNERLENMLRELLGLAV